MSIDWFDDLPKSKTQSIFDTVDLLIPPPPFDNEMAFTSNSKRNTLSELRVQVYFVVETVYFKASARSRFIVRNLLRQLGASAARNVVAGVSIVATTPLFTDRDEALESREVRWRRVFQNGGQQKSEYKRFTHDGW